MERYIFDIDGTILQANWEEEREFLKTKVLYRSEEFLRQRRKLLMEYEKMYKKYSVLCLSKHFEKYGFIISPLLIEEWINFNGNYLSDFVIPEMKELLILLKNEKKKCSIVTNWFLKTQISRLERSSLLPFFDIIVGGDTVLKPSPQSYLNACGNTSLSECIMIGDDYEKDYLGARKIGMNACLITDKNRAEMIRKIKVTM